MSELTVGQLRGLPINSNIIRVPTGHTLYAPGSVIQVINVDYLGRASQSVAGATPTAITGLEARITPRSTTSRIVIQARWFGELSAVGLTWDSVFGLSRNGVQIARQTEGVGSTNQNGITIGATSYTAADADSTPETMSFFTSDLPNTLSEVVYRVTWNPQYAGTIFTNRTVSWSGQANGFELGTSGMMLMEVAQ